MDWAATELNTCGARCTPLVFIDANSHVGSRELLGTHGQQLNGTAGAQLENRNTNLFKRLLSDCELQAVNTIDTRGSGVTWSGGRGKTSRVDYLLLPTTRHVYIDLVKVDYRGLSLQLAQTLHWLDHAPLFCLFWTMCWFEAEETLLPARLSKEDTEIFHRAPDLQEELRINIEIEAVDTAEEWHTALTARDPDAAQRWMTNTLNTGLQSLIPRLKQRQTFHGNCHEENCDDDLKIHRLTGPDVQARLITRCEYWQARRFEILKFRRTDYAHTLEDVQKIGELSMTLLSILLYWQWHAHLQTLQKLLHKAHKAAIQ